MASVRRKPHSAFQCQVCEGRASSYIRDAAQVLASVPGLGPVAFEAQLIPGLPKLFDFWWPEQGLAGELDGEGHFVDSCFGLAAEDQCAWDRHVDALCTERGLRLVRLHYKDRNQWAHTVQQAQHSQQVVTYTKSYGL